MSFSILALIYDLIGAAIAASLSRVLITPSAKLAYTIEDDELGKLRNYGSGIAFILGLLVIGTRSPLTGIPGTIGVGLVVPILVGLYLSTKRAPELLQQWKQSCDQTSGEILDGIKTGTYVQKIQPALDQAKLQATELVTKLSSRQVDSAELQVISSESPAEPVDLASDVADQERLNLQPESTEPTAGEQGSNPAGDLTSSKLVKRAVKK